jgi:glycosyltransferase involved in cell wall biosynthesis
MNATILTIGCYPSTGGPSKSVRAFQRALNARIIAWVDPGELAREKLVFESDAVVQSVSYPGLRTLLYPDRSTLGEAEEIIASSDLVSAHLFWRWHCPWLHRAAVRHAVPYWFVPHGGLDPYVFQTNGVIKRLFAKSVAWRFLNEARAVVCSTNGEYQKLRRHLPNAEPFILPWPLDNADIRQRDEASRLRVRQRLGIPDSATCLLFLGRLHRMKRPLETISAVAKTREKNVHLILVGNEFGVSIEDCKRHARSLGIENRVHVIGPVYGDDKREYFDAADVFISLSHRENFNFSAMEALASGLPLILSPGNDISVDLEPLECGWMLSNNDAASEAIEAAAVTPPVLLAAMGNRGREWAERSLRFETFRDRLRSFADRLVATSDGYRYRPPRPRA